ncbi:MAG: DUF6046 domain-containing protein [Lentimicrobium sp.]|jgi:hypothetical protein|nr:DUF6046 domain-containing protein [Lentimicrobium sp.]
MITHDLRYILATVYGRTGIPFPALPVEGSNGMVADEYSQNLNREIQKVSKYGKALYGTNLLGRPVFLPAILDGLELQNPVVSITGKKTIVETPMVGGNGTVKEIINIQDYSIKIICTDMRPDNLWPEDGLHAVKELWAKNKALTLECALTDVFLQAKDNVVITGITLPEMMGIEYAQVYEINLVSDFYFELELI